ncbi:MAG: chemotaxis protein CheW [Pedosphaera sp. Tous-C6FEB]|nr:MAG: chemotaxis protein CheW [Pedosphaera sp. Tous-C6FEB]
MSNIAPTTTTTAARLAGKHLTFVLGQECYGVPVLKVREIIRHCDITPVPQMPPHIKGVINLRGKIIPVADLRLKFRLAKAETTDLTCIVVVQVASTDRTPTVMGLIVDAVEEVTNITATDIEPTPDFGGAVESDYILGMAKIKGTVKTLLDIDHVVTAVKPA